MSPTTDQLWSAPIQAAGPPPHSRKAAMKRLNALDDSLHTHPKSCGRPRKRHTSHRLFYDLTNCHNCRFMLGYRFVTPVFRFGERSVRRSRKRLASCDFVTLCKQQRPDGAFLGHLRAKPNNLYGYKTECLHKKSRPRGLSRAAQMQPCRSWGKGEGREKRPWGGIRSQTAGPGPLVPPRVMLGMPPTMPMEQQPDTTATQEGARAQGPRPG